jgi:hypothetical protein
VKLSRSESLVLRKIMESEEKGLSYNELSRTLKGELSNQGLSDALKGLQLRNLVHRDFMGRTRGSHAMYKSTATSIDALYTNDIAGFVASRDVVTEHIPTPIQLFETPCFHPIVTMIRSPGEAFEAPEEKENLGKKLRDAAEYIVSAWLAYRQKHYNENSLEVVKEYEDAFARYLWLFACQTKKWAPGAVNEHLKKGPYTFVDTLELVERKGNLDWPLQKYHITEEEHQRRRKNFPRLDDELGPMSVKELRKVKAVVYNRKKREMYETYLRSLIPPKNLVLIDFGVLPKTGQKRIGAGKIWGTSGRAAGASLSRPTPQASSASVGTRSPGILLGLPDLS